MHSRKRHGLYRVSLPELGECARVDSAAGDAYPYLERSMYETLGFWPTFDKLPEQTAADKRRHKPLWDAW
ncbi:hypothetical protein [Novosphingobium pentaromativorans]|uniref:Uncharacterized protein n=1 Tax=Novosphingobium pentaromativorans US6-1 TaxID=1088721 RepID=G6EFY3_9SPHN|nr:hypothetical protein [Novosphingobium pentaromativorans]AIT82318.1 hypothetical protein JI59_22700 [Novosphingobium pentaromativorans US6-1]EHJ59672.1 hypothetical protein NSU_3254 [Novosphingobium pentaromativorans US6-1]